MFITKCDQKNGCANAIFVIVPTNHFGAITAEHDPVRNEVTLVAESWSEKLEWGAHFVYVGGIVGQLEAQSVILFLVVTLTMESSFTTLEGTNIFPLLSLANIFLRRLVWEQQ